MLLGPFALEAPIARGGTGVVWRARHPGQAVPVAVKVLSNADDAELLRAEVQAVAALDHPGVIRVFDQGTVPADVAVASAGRLVAGAPWLAMEFASGGSLKYYTGLRGWADVRSLLVAVLDALAHAHARGVIHRDIKPGNVLLGGATDLRPGPKLADFGLAHVADGLLGDAEIRGTPAYMAPEQFQGAWRAFGPWTDLYGLGVVAWELVTGKTPYRGDARAIATAQSSGELPEFSPLVRVPDGLEAWLRGMLARSPSRRVRRAADAAAGLLALPSVDEDSADASVSGPSLLHNPTLTLDDTLAMGEVSAPDERPFASSAPGVAPHFPATWRRAETPPVPPQLVGAGLALYGLREVPLIGREVERDRLWDALAAARRERATRVVLLHGAAGNGKSRLAQWVGQRAHELGAVTVLQVNHGPTGGPMDGLIAGLSRYFRIFGLTAAAAAEQLRAHPHAPDPDAVADAVSGGKGTAEERWRVVEGVLAAIAAVRPVYLWLDDIQWGPDALGFLAWLRDRPPVGPVLVVATAQAEALAEQPSVAARVEFLASDRVEIGPLGVPERLLLVRALLGLEGDLAARLAERTGGNPLFTVQLVGDWVARGVLVPGRDGFALRPGERAVLPDDLYQVWSARLARLLADLPSSSASVGRRTLELAAALGQEVDAREWAAAVAQAGVAIPEGLVDALRSARLIWPTDEGWAFSHGMLRESLQRHAVEADRWRAHNEACAVALTRLGEIPEIRLGRHWYSAGHWARAAELLRRGAEEALADGPANRSSDALRVAEDALRRAAVPDSDRRWGELWLARARVAVTLGQLDDAQRDAQRVATWARRHRWAMLEPRAHSALGEVFRRRGSLPQAVAALERALPGYEAEGDAIAAAEARVSLAHGRILGGDGPGAEALLAEAKEVFSDHSNQRGLAQVLRFEGDAARLGLRYGEAWEKFRDAAAISTALGDRSRASMSLHGMAEMDRLLGRLDEAETGYRAVIRYEDTLGKDAQIARINLGLCLTARARYSEARALLEALLAELTAQRKPGYQAIVHAALVAATAGCGDWTAFDGHFDRYDDLAAQTGLIDIDIALGAEGAAGLAASAGQQERADRAWELAGTIWEALGEQERAEVAFSRRTG